MTDATASATRLELEGSDGLRLVADSYGPDDGPPVLFLHGGGQTRHAWGATAATLGGDGWRVLTVDQRGHGDSEWPIAPLYDTDHFAADIRAVCAHLEAAPVVIGASLGGMATLLAQDGLETQLYAGVVLVDITPRMEVDGVRRIVGFMLANPDGFASLDEAAATIAAYRGQVPRRGAGDGLRKVLRQAGDGRWRWHWDPRFILSRDAEGGFDQAHTEQRLELLRERLLAAASQVRVPSLLVRGAQSDLVSEEGARELLTAMPDARYVDVSGAGHMVAGDRNDVFTDEVRRFVSSLHG